MTRLVISKRQDQCQMHGGQIELFFATCTTCTQQYMLKSLSHLRSMIFAASAQNTLGSSSFVKGCPVAWQSSTVLAWS